MSTSLGFEVKLALHFDDALQEVTNALAEEGFGVLTRVDIHAAFKKKLGVDFRPYAILGACNPKLAHRALGERPEVGLLLPCNVTVEACDDGGTLVRIIDPDQMMRAGGMDSDAVLAEVGREARSRLSRVAASLGG